MSKVGIVIVSHSRKVAEGTADMVRQMVGGDIAVAHAGGNAAGGLGTDIGAIKSAIVIGILHHEGIVDTLRVSLTGNTIL